MEAATEPSILVIDDYVDLAEPLTRLLRRMGYAVETIHDGEDAIKYLMKQRPSLVILDLFLPDIGGIQVLQWLRTQRSCKNLPVMVYTSATENDLLRQAVEAGANEVWLKGSMDFFQIVARVESYIPRPNIGLGE